jgi:hypothetical protein
VILVPEIEVRLHQIRRDVDATVNPQIQFDRCGEFEAVDPFRQRFGRRLFDAGDKLTRFVSDAHRDDGWQRDSRRRYRNGDVDGKLKLVGRGRGWCNGARRLQEIPVSINLIEDFDAVAAFDR